MYRITIVKIEDKEVLKNVYVGKEMSGTNSSYVDQIVKEKVETQIYQQLVEKLDVSGLIGDVLLRCDDQA